MKSEVLFIMNEDELIKKIKEIIFSVPGEIYKFIPPKDCFDGEWEEASMQEKAFLLIEELLLNYNREDLKQKKEENSKNDVEIEIPIGPRFYSSADENMFFRALNSIPSIRKVQGSGRGLFLYFKTTISNEEKEFLKGLFNRYELPIPINIEK